MQDGRTGRKGERFYVYVPALFNLLWVFTHAGVRTPYKII